MALGKDAAKIIVNAWAKVRWTLGDPAALTDLGFTGVPTVKIEPEFAAKLTAQTGKVALGDSFVGAAIEIVTPLLQPDLELLREMVPWAPAEGSIKVLPDALGYDLYDAAALLNLHPLSAADNGGEDNTGDLNLIKAVPTGGLEFVRDGEAHDVVPVTWKVYPDRSQLPLLVWGYVGAVPE